MHLSEFNINEIFNIHLLHIIMQMYISKNIDSTQIGLGYGPYITMGY